MKLLPSDPIVRDVCVFLAVKLVLIIAIWAAFFRGGADAPRPAADAAAVAQALLERAPDARPAHTPDLPKGKQ